MKSAVASSAHPYSVTVSILPCKAAGSSAFDLTLFDHQYPGWFLTSTETLDFSDPQSRDFLRVFLNPEPGEFVTVAAGLAFGQRLAGRLFSPSGLGAAWRTIGERRARRPIRLELVLPADDGTGRYASAAKLDEVPFELLADEGGGGFWFRRPGWCLVRTFEELPAQPFRISPGTRALCAWANTLVELDSGTTTKLSEAIFEAHEAVFMREATALGLSPRTTLRRTTYASLGACLRERPETPVLSLVAHGGTGGGTVVLHAADDSDEGVGIEARTFAKVCRDGGVQVALLWICHGARRHAAFSSLADALLAPDQGNAAAVVASSAALVADRTAAFLGPLLRSLRDVAGGDLERAVTEGRYALAEDDLQWAAPVYYARPYQGASVSFEVRVDQVLAAAETAATNREVDGMPAARPWFRGRQDEIARVIALLAAHRLVTLIGLPGTGKTALAAAVAGQAFRERLAGIEHAVWLDVAARSSVPALREALAALFGLEATRWKDDLTLAKALGARRALVVLDNVEDLLHADGEGLRLLIDALQRYARDLRILATSRRALGSLDGAEEQPFTVLRLPPGVDREVFLAVAGARLADERGDAAAVDELVNALAGHPQSIVLVAGQVGRGRSLGELLARVKAEDAEVVHDAELLDEDVAQTPDARLRTRRLVSSLNLSFQPLVEHVPRAAEMFVWLAGFPAGLPRVLMEEVFGPGAERYAGRLLAVSLVERSGPDDRLVLPGPVRWYARARLDATVNGKPVMTAARKDELVERSVAALSGWLGALKMKLGQRGAAAACERAAAEGTNLASLCAWPERLPPRLHKRAAAGFAAYSAMALHGGFHRTAVVVGEQVHATLHGEGGAAAVIGGALGNLYVRADRLKEAEEAYEKALPQYRASEESLGEANTLGALGDLYVRTDRLKEAEEAYEKALPQYRASEESLGEANTLLALGELYVRTARLKEAEDAYERVLAQYQAIEARLGEANTLKALGILYVRTERLKEAEEAYGKALPLYQVIEDRLGEANTLRWLGALYVRKARLKEAEDAYERALSQYRAIEDRLGEANTLGGLGALYVRKAKLKEAEEVYERALSQYRAIGDRLGKANTLRALGALYMRTDRLKEAEEAYEKALSEFRAIGARLGEANTQKVLGDLYVRTDRLKEAENAYEEALSQYRAIKDRLGEASTLQGFGGLALERGASSAAFGFYLDALALQRELDDRLGMAGTHGYLARVAARAGRGERAIVLGCRALAMLQQIDDVSGQSLVVQDLLVLLVQREESEDAVLVLAWALARRLGDAFAGELEPMIWELGIDLETVSMDELVDAALVELKAWSERYEQILRDRGEDPYAPLEDA